MAKKQQAQTAASAAPRIHAAERSVELLLCIASRQGSASLRELTEQVGFSKSTVHRLLGRLERIGVVERDKVSQGYRGGPRLRNAVRVGWNDFDPRRIAYPLMEELRNATGETVSFHMRDGFEHVVVEVCEGLSQVRRVLSVGQRWPLFTGASARAMLASLPDEQVQSLLKGGAKLAKALRHAKRPTDVELRAARKLGYAISVGEITGEITALAAPVFDSRGIVWGALTVSGPLYRFTRSHAQKYAPALLKTVAKISPSSGQLGQGEGGRN